MTPALIISFAVCSSAAILLSGMLIYHDIDDKANSMGWERAIADLGNICRLSTNVWLPVYYVARLLTTGFSMTVALIMTSTARQALYSNLAQQFSCM
jgi:hypothetical protein